MDHLQSERDFNDLYTLRPSDDDVPSNHYESEFAFVELTSDKDIGTFYPDRYDVHYFYGTDFNSDHS